MGETEHDYIIEQIPAYALGALDAEEAGVVARHLPTCAGCQGELAAYEAVTDGLPLAAPAVEPSPALKGRLMEQIRPSPAPGTAVSAKPSWQQQINGAVQNLFARPRWQMATALLIVALIISNLLLWQRARQSSIPNHQIVLTGAAAAPDAIGIIYISRDGRYGALIVEDLPQLSPEQQYQLWLIEDGQRTSGGVFSVNEDGYHSLQIAAPRSLRKYGAFGVTIEPAGGSPAPTGERVLGYNL